jgi:hypothetical protein
VSTEGSAEAVICTRLDGARGSWAGTSGDLPEVGVSLLLHQKHFASTDETTPPCRDGEGAVMRAFLE